jgi:hypothetical protein
MGKYDAVAARAAAQIERKGATVVFPGAAPGTYDPLTDTWSAGGAGGDVYGKAVMIQGDPDKLAALGLIGVKNVALIISNKFTDADGNAVVFTPETPVAFQWPAGSTLYTTKDVDDGVGPDGVPIIFILTGGV